MSYIPKNEAEFTQLAQQGNVIPIAKTIPADLLTPVGAYLRLYNRSPYSFLLESVEGGQQVARYSFLGVDPHIIMRATNTGIEVFREGRTEKVTKGLLDTLREHFDSLVPVKVPQLPPFVGGAVGYINYDAVRWFEDIPCNNIDDLQVDNSVMMLYQTILAFDHVKQQLVIVSNVFTENIHPSQWVELYQQALFRIEEIELLLSQPIVLPPKAKRTHAPAISTNISKEAFEAAVEQAKRYIKAGDIFQVVLSQRFEIDIVTHSFQIYRALRMVNPSPYMFYLNMADSTLIGSSPEMLVRCTGQQLDYRPIAGTRPRGNDDIEDALLGEELRADEKEVAEHIMLVDLGRNDLGRISEFGTVEVLDLMYIERYSHVMHLVSSLRGQLRPDKDCFDALAACFPAGTVSGAPKVRAMEIIDELETTCRGPYSGTILYVDYSKNLDSCIAIRTLLVKDGKAYLQTGAGIVADSIPEKEYIETVNKARALLKAIEISEKEL